MFHAEVASWSVESFGGRCCLCVFLFFERTMGVCDIRPFVVLKHWYSRLIDVGISGRRDERVSRKLAHSKRMRKAHLYCTFWPTAIAAGADHRDKGVLVKAEGLAAATARRLVH